MKEWTLGPEALPYLDRSLSHGWELARKVRSVDLSKGQVVTYLPEDADSAKVVRFDSGGFSHEGWPGAWVEDIMLRYLTCASGRSVVFETYWTPTDDWVRRCDGLQWFGHAGRLYAFVSSNCCSTEAIGDAIFAGGMFPSIAVLSQLSGGDPCSWYGTELAESTLDDIASGVDHLLVGAYDQESALLWTRPGAMAITGGGDAE